MRGLTLAAVIAVAVLAASVCIVEESDGAKGTVGGITWEYGESNHELTFSGKGPVPAGDNNPWTEYLSEVRSLSFGKGITTVPDGMFADMPSLTEVEVSSTVTDLGDGNFLECPALTSITVDGDNKAYDSRSGVLYSEGAGELLVYPDGKSGESFAIPDSVGSVAAGAFEGNRSIRHLTIPASLTSVGDRAFSGMEALEMFTVEEGNPELVSCNRGGLYSDNGEVMIAAPSSLSQVASGTEEIASGAFVGNDSREIQLPSSLRIIRSGAFEDCSLTAVDLPEGLETIESGAFVGCDSIGTVSFPTTIITVGQSAFDGYTFDLSTGSAASGAADLAGRSFSGQGGTLTEVVPETYEIGDYTSYLMVAVVAVVILLVAALAFYIRQR